MYNKDRFHSPGRASFFLLSVLVEQSGVRDVVVGMGVHQRGMVHVPVPHVQHHRHLWGGDEEILFQIVAPVVYTGQPMRGKHRYRTFVAPPPARHKNKPL